MKYLLNFLKSKQQQLQHLFDEKLPLEGIFSDIIKLFGKNSIVVSTSGNSNSDYCNTLNKKFIGAWISSPNPNSWIKFDVKTIRIAILGYTLRVCPASRNVAAPHSWCIEGSNDNFKWFLIDEHRKDYCLQSSKPQNFSCQAQLLKIEAPDVSSNMPNDTNTVNNNITDNNSFRYIRIRQTDVNVLGGNSLCLSNVELFGYFSTL